MLKFKSLVLPSKIKKGNKANQNSLHFRQEVLSAVKRYQDASGVGKFGRKRLIYSRPWFLICGPTGSGKSTLLNKCGVSWDAVYPDEPDEQIQWRFASEAVWIDIPGCLLEDSAVEDFRAFLEALARVRGRRPLDGILIVTDCGVMLNSELLSVKFNAESLRKRIDQIIKLWGIELPVYHVFSNADKITGFNTIFSDPAGKWNERVLGASLNESTEKSQKTLFLEELSFILDWIKEILVKMLARDKNQANRRLMCQFPVMFESMREKISTLISTMFRKSDFTGKPLFSGFFFTSCQTGGSGLTDSDERIFDVSKTIISHPLNPNKKKSSVSQDFAIGVTETVTSYFAKPLFKSVIPKHAAPISTTVQKYRHDTISLFWKSAAAVLILISFALFQWRAATSVRAIDKKVRTDFSIPVSNSSEGIKQLYLLMKHYHSFQNYAKIPTFSMLLTRYDAEGMYSKVKDAFISSVFNTIVLPCSKELNNQQTRMVNLSQNSSENDFQKLKNLLQTYLAISRVNNSYSNLIDKKVLVPVLRNMAVSTIFGVSDVTSSLDTMIVSVISEYIDELQKSKESKYRTDVNEKLVSGVQKKLVSMFDVNAVYSMACNDLMTTSKNMELIDIVGNDIPLNLKSIMTLNEMYTPAGWNANVSKKFKEASRLRENIEDWVIGRNKSTFSGIFNDPKQLYDGLIQRYREDVRMQWRDFLNSVSMGGFSSIQIAQERLFQVSGPQSDIARLIGKFSDWSAGFTKNDSGKVNEPELLKFTDEMAFLRQVTGVNIPQYQKEFEKVAKGLAKSSEDNSILGVFTGREGDPMLGTYQFITSSVILPLSKDQKGFLEHILMEPYYRTIDMLKPELAKKLSEKWMSVYEWFDGSLNRMYPFVDNDKEASFDAVMDFFNPVSGIFWKTYNDYFSPYITKDGTSKFVSRNIQGSIPVKFSRSFFNCLDKADTVSQVFFKNGRRKSWKVAIMPQSLQNTDSKGLKNAVITLGKESVAVLTEPGKSLRWPVDGDNQSVQLVITDYLDRNGRELLHGSWSFMRLMNSSCYISGNIFQSSFPVQLKTSHNAIIQITLPAKVMVSSSDPAHPFCSNVFKGFSVPKNVF